MSSNSQTVTHLAAIVWITAMAQPVLAHRGGGYSHDSSIRTTNADWMSLLPGDLRISELSLPGTHDSLSKLGNPIVDTQSMNLRTQLQSGIRVLDVRLRYYGGGLLLHHGQFFLNEDFDGVLTDVTRFLDDHPGETVLMRVKQEYSDVDTARFTERFLEYIEDKGYGEDYGGRVWNGTHDNPRLDDIRGRIVILQQGLAGDHGVDYGSFDIQDRWHLGDPWGIGGMSLYEKWEAVEDHLEEADDGSSSTVYVNYLSGSGEGSLPYFVASGHADPGTADARLFTGLTTPAFDSYYPDFPRRSCRDDITTLWIQVCKIFFEGTNELTLNRLRRGGYDRVGILMIDFPGPELIEEIIALNTRSDATVNAVSSGEQREPAIATDAAGNTVVVWEDDQDDNGYFDIYMRGFSADGSQRFSQRRANGTDSGQQRRPDVATDASGNFVVTWLDDQDGNHSYDVLARGFDAFGNEVIDDFRVNAAASGQQLWPAIAMSPSGEFVVVWQDDKDGNGYYDIRARAFAADGSESIADFRVNRIASGRQRRPDVAMDALGDFVVVWEDDNDGNGFYEILARGFDGSSGAETLEIGVNSVGTGQQYQPVVAMDHSGNFVVAWADDKDGNRYYDILARGFDHLGNERFHDRTVNSIGTKQQSNPSIAMNGAGDFVVAWRDDQGVINTYNLRAYYKLFARVFDADGREIVNDFRVHQVRWVTSLAYFPDELDASVSLSEYDSGGRATLRFAWRDDRDGNFVHQIRSSSFVITRDP